jgi:hypothetical protein
MSNGAILQTNLYECTDWLVVSPRFDLGPTWRLHDSHTAGKILKILYFWLLENRDVTQTGTTTSKSMNDEQKLLPQSN